MSELIASPIPLVVSWDYRDSNSQYPRKLPATDGPLRLLRFQSRKATGFMDVEWYGWVARASRTRERREEVAGEVSDFSFTNASIFSHL